MNWKLMMKKGGGRGLLKFLFPKQINMVNETVSSAEECVCTVWAVCMGYVFRKCQSVTNTCRYLYNYMASFPLIKSRFLCLFVLIVYEIFSQLDFYHFWFFNFWVFFCLLIWEIAIISWYYYFQTFSYNKKIRTCNKKTHFVLNFAKENVMTFRCKDMYHSIIGEKKCLFVGESFDRKDKFSCT